MPQRLAAPTPTPKTYPQLRDAVIAVVVKGRDEIDRAWVATYHETGRLINAHVLQFRERANYGAKVYEKLSQDTDISKRTLQECAQFHRYFPIARHVAQLGWNRCRLLCQVDDEAQRAALTTQALKNDLSSGDIVERVRSINAVALDSGEKKTAEPVELLTPRCGTPGLHPIVDRGSGPEVDLGFKFYRELGPTSKLTTNDIVRLSEDGVRKVENATTAQLFTYCATVRKIVDGDTLVVAIAVAPGFSHELKLRLRGLDCPEVSTAAGRAAKAFVDDLLEPGDEVILSTTKPDKYDRYLADVFVATDAAEDSLSDSSLVTDHSSQSFLFLNNLLLENSHAIRYDGGAKDG
jgi:endonuclease YncB( thermonuclease family)